MPTGKQETEVNFGQGREGFMEQFFGGAPGQRTGWNSRSPSQPPPGLTPEILEQYFGNLTPQASPLQRQSTDAISNYLNQQAPEQRAFQMALQSLNPMLTGTGQFGNIATAATPIFNRNLSEGISQLGAAAPGRFGSAFLQQGTDLAGRATQDFNLFIQQARQQDIMNRLQANLTMGTLGQQAGEGTRAGLFGAGQFGLQQTAMEGSGIQNRLALQQMLMQMLNTPTGQTTTSSPGFMDYAGMLANIGTAGIMARRPGSPNPTNGAESASNTDTTDATGTPTTGNWWDPYWTN